MTQQSYPVYIQANARMALPARVAAHSFARFSRPDVGIEPHIMWLEDCPTLLRRDGQVYRESGRPLRWRTDDLCSFMPTRMRAASLAGFEGRALVTDPDVFALRDPLPLLRRDMQGKAIYASPPVSYREGPYESAVMLIDCAKLRHWDFEAMVDRMFRGELDYGEWERLALEDPATVGALEPEWNSMDVLTDDTRFLHTTNYRTWPWKTGLHVEFWEDRLWVRSQLEGVDRLRIAYRTLRRTAKNLAGRLTSRVQRADIYPPHPDPCQERVFFRLLAEALDAGALERADVEREIRLGHVRGDLWSRVASEPTAAGV